MFKKNLITVKNFALTLGSLFLLASCSEEFSNDTVELQTEKPVQETLNLKASSRSLNQVSTNSWLSNVSDNTKLIDLSLVGTHDAGAYKNGGSLAICQQDNITTQLNAGVRYLDIRLDALENEDDLQLYHGVARQDLGWDTDIYPTILQFLNDNPSEFIFVVLKNENGNNKALWKQKVLASLSAKSNKILRKISNNTTLREARGKIIVLNRDNLNGQYNAMSGIRYNNDANGHLNGYPMFFSDKFKVPTLFNSSIQNKFNTILNGINNASQVNSYNNNFVITNANGSSLLAHPRNIANRINPMIISHITNNNMINDSTKERLGYLVIDFATSPKGREIINLWINKTINSYGKQ